MKANDEKLVPKHYASTYIHWDLVIATGMGYLEGNATKYLARWRLKNGLEDLKKSLHYIDKLMEAASSGVVQSPLAATNEVVPSIVTEVARFVQANQLFNTEALAINYLATWAGREDLVHARRLVNSLIVELEQPAPASDSNKHADRASSDPTGW